MGRHESALVAAQTALGADQTLLARDVQDAAVPLRDQVANHLIGTTLLVGLDVDDVGQGDVRVQRDERRVHGQVFAGFGRHGRLHEEAFFELAGDLPVEVEFLVSGEQAERLLALLKDENMRLFYARMPAEYGISS